MGLFGVSLDTCGDLLVTWIAAGPRHHITNPDNCKLKGPFPLPIRVNTGNSADIHSSLNIAQFMISSISSSTASTVQTPDFTTTVRPHHGGHHGGASKLASDIISDADSDGDGSISKSELTTMLTKQLGSSASASDVSSKVDAIFKQVDTDGNGEISKSELTNALKKAHDEQQAQAASGSAASGDTDSLASVMSSLMGPPPDAGYNASGTATGSYNATTFSASA